MDTKNLGDSSAYPGGTHGTVLGGLTKRELFAMHFMPAIYEEFWKEASGFSEDWRVGLAKDAALLADALLAELAKDQP